MRPHARQHNLLVEEIGAEALVYDLERHQAHRLSRPAAVIWRHADGQRTVADLARIVETELAMTTDNEVVWLVLGELERAYLLRELLLRPRGIAGVSRRQALSLGLAGAATILLEGCGVDSTTAPSPIAEKIVPAGTCNCIVPRQPLPPNADKCKKKGHTDKTTADGTCLGTDPNCPTDDKCTLTATWECNDPGGADPWLLVGRESDCKLKKPKKDQPSPSPSPSPGP